MAITHEELRHGMVIRSIFLALNEESESFRYRLFQQEESRSSYEIMFYSDSGAELFQIGLFIKHSSARRSPWRYSFAKAHQQELSDMHERCAAIFVILFAGDDGVACLSYQQLKVVLDEYYDDVEWVALSRKHNQSFRVSGKDGSLDGTLPRKSFPDAIIKKVTELL